VVSYGRAIRMSYAVGYPQVVEAWIGNVSFGGELL